jgi:hypothetical protein
VAEGLSLCVPDRPGLAVQLAVQLVALVLLQASVVLAPALIAGGVAVSVAVGNGTVLTVTTVEVVAVPPDPVQVSV